MRDIIILIACVALTWAIWVRRSTLRPQTEHAKLYERCMTAALICQLFGLTLMSPYSSPTIDRILHAVFNQWNLGDYIGHCLYIGAAGLIGVNIGSRLNITEDELRAYFLKYFARPMTLIVPVLLALFFQSPAAGRYWPDFYDCPLDGWLMAYWAILCGFIAFILATIVWPLIVLRRDPRNRRTATLYIVGTTAGIIACLTRVFTVGIDYDFANWFWILVSIVAVAFAYASGRSWRQHVRATGPRISA